MQQRFMCALLIKFLMYCYCNIVLVGTEFDLWTMLYILVLVIQHMHGSPELPQSIKHNGKHHHNAVVEHTLWDCYDVLNVLLHRGGGIHLGCHDARSSDVRSRKHIRVTCRSSDVRFSTCIWVTCRSSDVRSSMCIRVTCRLWINNTR